MGTTSVEVLCAHAGHISMEVSSDNDLRKRNEHCSQEVVMTSRATVTFRILECILSLVHKG